MSRLPDFRPTRALCSFFFLLTLGLPVCSTAFEAYDQDQKVVPAVATAIPPVIDGILDDEAWKNAPLITQFYQVEPIEFGEPTQRTEVRVLYDDKYLYISGRLFYTDMKLLTANIMVPKQRVFQDDRLYIMLDPFLDRRNGYLFEANANGIQGDALIENNSQRINEWSGVWQAQTTIDDAGWSVEFRIPFATVSFRPDGTNWGINFLRDIKKTQERLAWSSQGRQNVLEAPSAGGTLTGLQDIKQGLGLDLIPTITAVSRRDSLLNQTDNSFEPSLDVTYRITPSLTGKLTINTDFSGTEVDDRQINLTRFSLFFPEKRDFFLQDAGIFEFADLRGNGRPFFSRTIGISDDGEPLNLNYGGKLTGRIGRWNIGLLGVQQEASAQLGSRNLFVGRVAANVMEESSIGAIFTNGDPQLDRDARTFGADFRYRTSHFLGDNIFQGEIWYQQSDNESLPPDDDDPGADVSTDSGTDESAWGVHAVYPNDRHYVDFSVYRFGQDFDPAMGFVNRPGITDYRFMYRFRQRPQGGYWQRHDQRIFSRLIDSTYNDELSHFIEFQPWGAESRKSDRFRTYVSLEREVLEEGFDLFDKIFVAPGDYSYVRYGAFIQTARFREISIQGGFELGDFLNGRRTTLYGELKWTPAPRFNIEANYRSNDVMLPTGNFTARVMSLRSEIAISNRWSFIPLAQFDNVSNELGINLRLRWHPFRGSDLFLVWSKNMLRDMENRFQSLYQETVLKGTYTFRF